MKMILIAALYCALGFGVGFLVQSRPVQAAPANVCEAVATAGNITVYYCEPDYGLPFYVNSVGFMALED